MDELFGAECFQQVVALAAAGVCGQETLLHDQQIMDWSSVVRLAMSQSVLPIVG